MKIMTFNILHALDFVNQKIDIDLYVEKIKHYGADICGLNEVRGEGPVEGYTDQTNAIADGLGYNRYFGEAIKVEDTSPYGNALVTLYTFKSCETILIPEPSEEYKYDEDGEVGYYERRCVIKAVIDCGGKDLCVLVTHMGLSDIERRNAVSLLCEMIDDIDIPLVLMGDFNTTPDDAVLAPIYERLIDTNQKSINPDVSTYPSNSPEIKIDYIFYRGINCVSSQTIEEVISDHYPIIADFEY
jgi:endonuclease/exonuclease/phosphatase family metal-dependent hydrolase